MTIKKFLAVIFLSALIFSIACVNLSADERPVLMMLSTKTCPACKQMAKVLKQLNKDYPAIKTQHIYFEDGKHDDLFAKYDVEYVPTLIFKDENGKFIARKVGYMSEKQVIKIFKEAGVQIN